MVLMCVTTCSSFLPVIQVISNEISYINAVGCRMSINVCVMIMMLVICKRQGERGIRSRLTRCDGG